MSELTRADDVVRISALPAPLLYVGARTLGSQVSADRWRTRAIMLGRPRLAHYPISCDLQGCANQCPCRTGVAACRQSNDWDGTKTAAQRLRGGAFLDIAAGFADSCTERATLMLIDVGFLASRCL